MPCGSGKCDNPIPHFASAGLNWEWADTLDHYGRSLLVTFAKHFSASGHLGQEDEPFVNLTIAIGERADQEYSPFAIDLDLAVAEIRNLHGDWPSSGANGNLINYLLRKRIEHD